jgi:hypothetical protein
LGAFHPIQDLTLDSRVPFVNGRRVTVRRFVATGRAVTLGVFNFSDVYIPDGVTIRFSGYTHALVAANGDMTIAGKIDANGKDGLRGDDGCQWDEDDNIIPFMGVGGNGGAGGVGSGGQGSGGLGGTGAQHCAPTNTWATKHTGPRAIDGTNGAGSKSPGDTRQEFKPIKPGFYYNYDAGGGGGGGGNGTPGADGQWFQRRPGDFSFYPYVRGTTNPAWFVSRGGLLFGQKDFGVTPAPAGGGGGGGFGSTSFDWDFGNQAGSGGGGGGGGGFVFLQATGIITVTATGSIQATGGRGGDGGNGVRQARSDVYTFFQVDDEWSSSGGGGGGGGAGGFIRIEAKQLILMGSFTEKLQARGGAGGKGGQSARPPGNPHPEGYFCNPEEPDALCNGNYVGHTGGGGGGGRIVVVTQSCSVQNGSASEALSAATAASCPLPSDGTPASGTTPGEPTILTPPAGDIKIEEFPAVPKDGEFEAKITVEGETNARVNLEIKLTKGEGDATFDDGSKMKPNVPVPGTELKLKLKGVKESSEKDNLKLIATLVSDTNKKAEEPFSVVAIKKVEWVNTGQLTNNTHPSGTLGLRIFPDASAASGSAQNKVKVKATITPAVEKVEVCFRSIDVDDPSSNDDDLDDEKQTQDNHGTPKDGKFTDGATNQASKKTNASGEAEVEFQVTRQPGDNFRVVATCVSKEALAGDKVKARRDDSQARVQDDANKDINDDMTTVATKKASDVLTVWRYLHVEVDSMDAPPDEKDPASAVHAERNFIKGDIVRIESDGGKLWVVPRTTKPQLTLHDGSPHLGDNSGQGRFEKGMITIGTSSPVIVQDNDVKGNGFDSKATAPDPSEFVEVSDKKIPFRLEKGGNVLTGTVEEMAKKNSPLEFKISESVKNVDYSGGLLMVAGVTFTVTEAKGNKVTVMQQPKLPFVIVDDDREISPFLVKPPEGEDMQASTPFELMQRSDSAERNLYTRAYVKPRYNLSSKTASFKRNVEDGDAATPLINVRPLGSAPSFWVAHVLGAFQGPAYQKVVDPVVVFRGDGDPDIEARSDARINRSVVGGATPKLLGLNPERLGSLIYREALRDSGLTLGIDCLAYSVIHEVGHQFGLPDRSGGIMEPCSPRTVNVNRFFTNEQLKIIR